MENVRHTEIGEHLLLLGGQRIGGVRFCIRVRRVHLECQSDELKCAHNINDKCA